jgi:hypothetical protein
MVSHKTDKDIIQGLKEKFNNATRRFDVMYISYMMSQIVSCTGFTEENCLRYSSETNSVSNSSVSAARQLLFENNLVNSTSLFSGKVQKNTTFFGRQAEIKDLEINSSAVGIEQTCPVALFSLEKVESARHHLQKPS